MALKDSLDKVAAHYDKIILVVVVLALVGSLAYLALQVGAIREIQDRFKWEIGSLKPKYPNAVPENVVPYEQAEASISQPFQLPAGSNTMFVPETRVWCLECLRPVPIDENVCPFCGFVDKKPTDVGEVDTDKDGIKDRWEIQYGMNRYDPRDASQDQDGDGFTALEEFRNDPPTDPTDPQSTPPIEAKLRVVELKPDPFDLRFKSKILQPGGENMFGLNMRGKTYFVMLGETVLGFKLVDYEEKSVKVMRNGIPLTVDVSVLTLERGEKKVSLIRGKDVQYDEYTIKLRYLINDTVFTVKKDEEFELQVQGGSLKYKLIGIDTEREGVVIERLHDRARIDVWKERNEINE